MVALQNDLLRYTIVIKTARYSQAVKAIVEALNANSYSLVRLKNFWRKPGEAAGETKADTTIKPRLAR